MTSKKGARRRGAMRNKKRSPNVHKGRKRPTPAASLQREVAPKPRPSQSERVQATTRESLARTIGKDIVTKAKKDKIDGLSDRQIGLIVAGIIAFIIESVGVLSLFEDQKQEIQDHSANTIDTLPGYDDYVLAQNLLVREGYQTEVHRVGEDELELYYFRGPYRGDETTFHLAAPPIVEDDQAVIAFRQWTDERLEVTVNGNPKDPAIFTIVRPTDDGETSRQVHEYQTSFSEVIRLPVH